MNELDPGIYINIEPQQYFALKYMSNTCAGIVHNKSPLHAKHYMDTGWTKKTEEMFKGTAAHTAILEPEEWDKRYAALPPGTDLRTKVGKELRAALEEANPGCEVIKSDTADMAWAMNEQVHRHPMAHAALTGAGQNEVTLVWDVTASNGLVVRCKGRIDRLTTLEGYGVIADYKTTQDASWDGFAKSAANYGYHRQAAMYLDGLNAIDLEKGNPTCKRRYIFIAQEKEKPYGAGVYELNEQSIHEGRLQYQAAINRWAACVEKGSFDGYSTEVDAIALPSWALKLTGETRYEQ